MANMAGNDSEAARRDLDQQYGEHASAEDLIRAHDQTLDGKMQAALQKPVDPVATDALDIDDIDPKFGGEIQAAAVRGGQVIVVEDVNGRLVKWSQDHASAPKAKSAARQASASVGGNPEADGGAPEGKGPGGGQASGAPAQGNSNDDDAEENQAPQNVTSQAIQDRLAALGIDVGSSTRKQQFWDLLPDSEQAALKEAADAA